MYVDRAVFFSNGYWPDATTCLCRRTSPIAIGSGRNRPLAVPTELLLKESVERTDGELQSAPE